MCAESPPRAGATRISGEGFVSLKKDTAPAVKPKPTKSGMQFSMWESLGEGGRHEPPDCAIRGDGAGSRRNVRGMGNENPHVHECRCFTGLCDGASDFVHRPTSGQSPAKKGMTSFHIDSDA